MRMLSKVSKFEMNKAAAQERRGSRLKNVLLAVKTKEEIVQNVIYKLENMRRTVLVPMQLKI